MLRIKFCCCFLIFSKDSSLTSLNYHKRTILLLPLVPTLCYRRCCSILFALFSPSRQILSRCFSSTTAFRRRCVPFDVLRPSLKCSFRPFSLAIRCTFKLSRQLFIRTQTHPSVRFSAADGINRNADVAVCIDVLNLHLEVFAASPFSFFARFYYTKSRRLFPSHLSSAYLFSLD